MLERTTSWSRSLTAALALGAGVLAGVSWPTTAAAQSDWNLCAREGEVCQVGRGEALVRFGADGRHAFRVVRGEVVCDTAHFGDPAPGRRKRCQVSENWREDSRYRGWRERDRDDGGRWRVCANENEICTPPAGATQVRYGANGRYVVRDVRRPVMCSNRVFGDPAPDVAKQCEYSLASGRPEPQRRPDPGRPDVGRPDVGRPDVGRGNWDLCANEGEMCRFRGSATVRYGAEGRWVYRDANDAIQCLNEEFSADPAPGRPKICEVRRGR